MGRPARWPDLARPDGPTWPGLMARPGPARKWPGLTSYFGPTGRAWAEKSGPIDKIGQAWAGDLRDLGKARPDNPTIFWPNGPGLGRKNVARQSSRAGPRQQFFESGFLLARPNPARPDDMPSYIFLCIPSDYSA
jgi:hypothetical protein